jgi:hypothetical protein
LKGAAIKFVTVEKMKENEKRSVKVRIGQIISTTKYAARID